MDERDGHRHGSGTARLVLLLLSLLVLLGSAVAAAPGGATSVTAAAVPAPQILTAVQGSRAQFAGGALPAPADPYGAVWTLGTPYADRIVLSGWVADPFTSGPVRVDVTIDGTVRGGGTTTIALGGGSYAFDLTIPAPTGATTACAIARNTGPGTDTELGCRDLRPPPLTGGYTWMSTEPRGHPLRFDPCTPLTIAYDPTGGPPWGRTELDRAIVELRNATGFDIHVIEVSEPVGLGRPLIDLARYGARYSPILVGYADPNTITALAGGVAGLGGPSSSWGPDGRISVTGIVILDGPQATGLPTGWGTGPTLAKLITHELSHVLGLGHINDGTQLMNPVIPSRAGALGTGDRTGLTYLGATQPCRRQPPLPIAGTVTAAATDDPTSPDPGPLAPDGLPTIVEHIEID